MRSLLAAGTYSSSQTGVNWAYPSSRYMDKLMNAAAWLYRATGAELA